MMSAWNWFFPDRYGDNRAMPQSMHGARIEKVLAVQEGDDPWAVGEEHAVLALTGCGPFVVCRDAHYAYAVPAQPEDFRSVFGTTGEEFVRAPGWAAFRPSVRMSTVLLQEAWSFFHAAWKRYKTEDILLVTFFPEEQRYRLDHPELTFASPVSVGCTYPPTPVGAVAYGTIHSHPQCGAYHSPTDDADVAGIPGLHVVIGDLDLPVQTVACILSTGASCLQIRPGDVFEELASDRLTFLERRPFPAEWLVRPANLPRARRRESSSHRKEVNDGC